MTVRAHAVVPEEIVAAERAILGLTAGVGAMAAAASAVIGDPLALIAAPAIVLMALLVRGTVPAAGYAAMAVWLVFLLRAPGEAVLVPLTMAIVCLAIGMGPGRLISWARQDFGGRPDPEPPGARGWIEESRD
jgi:hypothetical protein